LKTNEGTIVLEELPANTEVMVDGATAKVRYGPGGKWLEVQVAPGERKLLITTPGFKVKTQDVALGSGERKPIRIHLEASESESKTVATTLGVCPSIAFRMRDSNNPVTCGFQSPDTARSWHEQDLSRVVP
jgi:hypothetical protein